ncbi:unnamed protein product [Lactuca virosa]|uniref:Retrotransposon gag domain-containing protein n=1 Tax=Lactuca virosa TaxID=75947 RepID=A0AAU9LD53_9ASTR|nr:unnamed protein product [Lactuca virosa]
MDQNQLKMDQKFEEILGAIAKSRPTINNEKKTVEGEPSNTPVLSMEETPRVYSGASHTDTGGSRTGGGSGGGGGDYITGGEYRGGTNRRFHKHEMMLFDGTNTEDWIFNVERSLCSYENEETMEAAMRSREGNTLLFYEWEHRRQPIRDWEELKGLIRRFRSPTSSLPTFRELEARNRENRDSFLNQEEAIRDRRQLATSSLVAKCEVTTLLEEDVTEVTFLGFRQPGLKIDKWAEINYLGQVNMNLIMGLYDKVDKSESPTEVKATTKIKTTTKPQSTTYSQEGHLHNDIACRLKYPDRSKRFPDPEIKLESLKIFTGILEPYLVNVNK